MAMQLVSIGLEEMIGITAMPSRHPPGQDVADALAKLLRENHVLTQELEESKEDVTMYEQVARDVETKWMLCEEVIGDLRSQVSRLMEQQQTCAQEAEDQAFANARRLFEMRKKLRRTSRTSSVCSRQSIVSMWHVLQPSEIGSESDLANGRRSGGESEGQGDSDSGGASDDAKRGQDMHWRSWRSFTSTLSGGSDGNLEKATSCDSHSKREKPQEQDSDDADKVSRPPLDIAEPFATRNCASQTLAIHTGAGDDTPPLNWTRKIIMGDKIPLGLGFCSHESSCEVKEAGVQDAAVPRTCICICNTVHVETNTTSSQTPHMWQTEVVKQRKENAWHLQQLYYGMGFGFVPLAPSSTPTDTVDSSPGIAESHGNPFVISTNTPSSDLNEAAAAVAVDVTAADAKRRDDEQQLAACATSKGLASHGLGIESSKDVGLQTSRWCMGAYVSDLLKIKQRYQNEGGVDAGIHTLASSRLSTPKGRGLV
mmetsp:Transcript_13619/g.19827  ORF Transcript_13619/g.19827 Transcript_13619/m.19827 type:complete len:483 (-) Transcript_13619:668-2116(-)